jgi:hypothetical protein
VSGVGGQDAIVALFAAIALAYLLWRRFGRRSRPRCSDCPGCASKSNNASEQTLITMSTFKRRRH